MAMEWQFFLNDPDICWPIVRRRIGEELLDLLAGYLEAVSTNAWSLTWNQSFPNRKSFRAAVRRLEKQGMLVSEWQGGQHVVIQVADGVIEKRSPSHTPHRFWRRKWDGVWYLLMYDVPEKDRNYRDQLRRFLTNKRMGCFQKSIWLTPHDIRPEYADLCEAASLERYAFLFQARTVLGRDPQSVVQASWDWESLRAGHAWYLSTCREHLGEIGDGPRDRSAFGMMAREEMLAYLSVMQADPLLPQSLHPPDYLGRKVAATHAEFMHAIASHL
jgi:phenylacetic acid degradation operon negative regulatory protein